jgi:superfamily I DNA/RNA helicase
MDGKPEYIRILRALMELPFQVGRNLLCDFLTGSYSNKSISKNRLDELDNFDSLSWDKGKVFGEIDRLISNGMIEMVQSDYNKFVKVLSLTIKGRNEITHPTLEAKRLGNRVEFGESKVSDEDREVFKEFGSFLDMYNDEQKKAIISSAKNLLCVAGAGSGKTTVLTKRIEFLVKYRGIDASKILAITFTRKARLEMEKRLGELGVRGVRVHTFNSFCEGILQRNGAQIYGRQVRVQSYGDKILAMNMAIATIGLNMESVIDEYFSAGQKKFRTASQLSNAFMNDCFAVMDYFKVSGKNDYDFSKDVDGKDRVNAERIYRITKYLRGHMETQGLRDYSDQIIDTIKFFREYPSGIPSFDHILVDEYQDVNAMQIELIELLASENLFAVGDPRQSIFGWRGSDVSFILDFGKNETDVSQPRVADGSASLDGSQSKTMDGSLRGDLAAEKDTVETIHLKKNYRSVKGVVDFMNLSIREMKLPDLEGHLDGEAKIRIENFANEDGERDFILREIEDGDVELGDIFILARTNKILLEISRVMKVRGISHRMQEDTSTGGGRRKAEGGSNGVILATVHAIKGLEAKKVFVVGANDSNFPCKATDHPAIEMVKADDYDREEEERRLFYVAVSRAKEELIITHTKKPTYYITKEMRKMVDGGLKMVDSKENVDSGLVSELKSWRSVVSGEASLPAYCVLTNKAIDEIAEKTPRDAEELSRVNGIGPEKLMKYGGKILEIVRDFGEGE